MRSLNLICLMALLTMVFVAVVLINFERRIAEDRLHWQPYTPPSVPAAQWRRP